MKTGLKTRREKNDNVTAKQTR